MFSVLKEKTTVAESSTTLDDVISVVENQKQSLTKIRDDLSKMEIEISKSCDTSMHTTYN